MWISREVFVQMWCNFGFFVDNLLSALISGYIWRCLSVYVGTSHLHFHCYEQNLENRLSNCYKTKLRLSNSGSLSVCLYTVDERHGDLLYFKILRPHLNSWTINLYRTKDQVLQVAVEFWLSFNLFKGHLPLFFCCLFCFYKSHNN